MASGRKVPINKSLVSLKKRVKVFSSKFLALFLQALILYTLLYPYHPLFFSAKIHLLCIIQSISFLSCQEKRESTEELESRVSWADQRRNAAQWFRAGKASSRNCPNETTDPISGKVQYFGQLLHWSNGCSLGWLKQRRFDHLSLWLVSIVLSSLTFFINFMLYSRP